MDKYINFFKDYTSKFDFKKKGIKIKYEHSLKVYEKSIEFINNHTFSENDNRLIKIISLFHDIGRFEQYKKYNTFNDYITIDHGKLGCDILKENNILKDFNEEEKDIILKSIFNHNKMDLPTELKEKELFHTKIIRDLDKLDIYRVYMDYYDFKEGNIREDYYNDIMNNRKINYNTVKNIEDYTILKISWVYDINFKYTIEKIKEEYLDILFKSIKGDDLFKKDLKEKIFNDIEKMSLL